MTSKDIGKRIDQLLEERGWSVYELIAKSGVSEATAYNTRNGNTIPRTDILERICTGFGISLGQFFTDDGTFDKSIDFTTEERDLIEVHRCLDAEDRASVKGYAMGLAKNKKKKRKKRTPKS